MEKNYGFLPHSIKAEDRVFGASKTIFTIQGIKDWEPYYSPGELQYSRGANNFDTMACVTFSAVKVVSAVMNYKLEHNQIGEINVKWLTEKGYLVNGKFDAAERHIAKLSGTTKQGNSADRVADAIRRWGLVPQSAWPFNPDAFMTWEEYYKEIPKEITDIGLEFLDRFEIEYDQVVMTAGKDIILEALSHSPLQVFIHAYDKPFNGVYQRSLGAINHAVSELRPEWFIFDHYLDPKDGDFIKELSKNFLFYPTSFAYNITELTPMTNVKIVKDKNSSAIYFALPQTSPEAFKSNCENYGIFCPTNPDGSVNWSVLKIDGILTLN